MMNCNKWAVLRLHKGVDSEHLPIRKISEVIKELKADGYIVINKLDLL